MVCLSSHGPNSEKLLRYGSRLAGRLNRNWYAVYVQTPSEEATVIDAHTQRILSETLTLAKQLGAVVFTYKGEDVADTLLRFAKEYRVGQIMIGRPRPRPFWKRWGKNKNIVQNLIKNADGVNIIVLDTREEKPLWTKPPVEVAEGKTLASAPPVDETPVPEPPAPSLPLSTERIILWDRPVTKNEVLRALAQASSGREAGDVDEVYEAILKREEQGSTFFNEGVAFPHVRVSGLPAPIIALGLTRAGVSDVATDKPIEIVFLILAPAEAPAVQVQLLGMASRAAQNRHLLQHLRCAGTPAEALEALRTWEARSSSTT
jgi:two-component system sensor histidine kinase KdpD